MSAKKSPVTVQKIIKKLGGPKEIEKILPVSASMVRKWPSMGIQWWHWPVIMDKGNFRAGDIYNANVLAAGKHYGLNQPSAASNAAEARAG